MADASPVGIFQADSSGALVYANKAFCEILQVPFEHIGLLDQMESWLRDLSFIRDGSIDRLITPDDQHKAELNLARPDGTQAYLHTSKRALFGADGEVVGYVGVLVDLTRYRELQTRLQKALDAAKAGAQAKTSFLANMSHEIRTPMNGVLGFAELLVASDLPSQERKYAQLIAESGRHMMNLINDILDLSKIEAQGVSLQRDRVDLRHKIATPRSISAPIIAAC